MISKIARDTLRGILADPASGFNSTLASICTAYDIPEAFEIDFENANIDSPNFFQGYIDLNTLWKSSAETLPCIILYTAGSDNGIARTKSVQFDGVVQVMVDIHLASLPAAQPDNFEDLSDAVEQTMITVCNRAEWFPSIYDKTIACQRSAMVFGPNLPDYGPAWIRTLRFSLTVLPRQ